MTFFQLPFSLKYTLIIPLLDHHLSEQNSHKCSDTFISPFSMFVWTMIRWTSSTEYPSDCGYGLKLWFPHLRYLQPSTAVTTWLSDWKNGRSQILIPAFNTCPFLLVSYKKNAILLIVESIPYLKKEHTHTHIHLLCLCQGRAAKVLSGRAEWVMFDQTT